MFLSVTDGQHCTQRFREPVSRNLIRGILPCGKLGCTGDLVTNCPCFLSFGERCCSFSHTINGPSPHLPFVFPSYGKGRVIVCHVTLRMCNGGPRAALALLVLVCSLTSSLASTFPSMERVFCRSCNNSFTNGSN